MTLFLLLAAPIDFQRDIAPLLAQRCLDCHSGADPKGALDLSRKVSARETLSPGKPGASALYRKVRDDKMPPKHPLPADEKELLRRWIAEGAKWEGVIDPFKTTTSKRAGHDWWSLQPVKRPAVPGGAAHPIDAFLLERLKKSGLEPSPEASRRTLSRRLSFGVTGLPPTPEDVKAFIEDERPDAYERLADKLLASPGFGERWARHWLDVARYGESDGFERDLPRFNSWPYRDWVVKALNEDLPYDRFARLQLAGDALKPGDPEALAATGFLVAGPHDIVVPAAENMKNAMRQDELEDIVGTTGQAFLGLTVHCARCHDHKFDPVAQKDYFRMVSALAGVAHGERSIPDARRTARLNEIAAEQEGLRKEIERIEDPVRRRLLAGKGKPAAPKPRWAWDFTRSLDADGLKGTLHGGAKRDERGLHVDGKGWLSTSPLPVELKAKTLQAWVRLADTRQRGGGVVSVQALDGGRFDAIVFGEQLAGRWMPGSEGFFRTKALDGVMEKSTELVHVAIAYDADGTVRTYRNGAVYGTPYKTTTHPFAAGISQVVFGLRHSPEGGNRMLKGTIVRAAIHDRALSAEEIAGTAFVSTAEIVAELKDADKQKHGRLIRRLHELDRETAKASKVVNRKMYAVNSSSPGVSRVLARGDVTMPGETVSAEVPGTLERWLGKTGLKPDAAEGDRRKALAGWIADRRNPLFARVMVNRLWHHHFGTGLVDTPSDFGFNGGKPTHPELLDWLAAELMENWSLKRLHRLIVTSHAYRQVSGVRKEAMAKDADNRLLWRKTPARLEAETMRDAMLATAGVLDRSMGGAPYLDFKTFFFKGTQFYEPLAEEGPAFRRRSLYRMWARGGRSPFLDTFDCPDPSASTPKRQATTTPLQALALLNNAQVFDLAEEMAARAGKDVGRAWQLAYQREPTERERALAEPFVRKNGMAALCRVLFNSGEFSLGE